MTHATTRSPQQRARRPFVPVLVLALTLFLTACGGVAPQVVPSAPARSAQSTAPALSPPTPAPTAEPTASLATPEPTAPAPSAAGAAVITVVEPAFKPPQTWHYEPTELTVAVGQPLTWTNTGAVLHTVTADDGSLFDSGNLKPQTSFRFTPSAAGTITYHCTLHPWMKGTILVTP